MRNALLFALGAVVLWFAVATASSLYGGTGRSKTLDSREQNITAIVQSCHRQGPISFNGLCYWWTCQATVGAATMELRQSVGPPRRTSAAAWWGRWAAARVVGEAGDGADGAHGG